MKENNLFIHLSNYKSLLKNKLKKSIYVDHKSKSQSLKKNYIVIKSKFMMQIVLISQLQIWLTE